MTRGAHIAFLLTGSVTTMLGPLLPVLAARWSLDDARAGHLFVAQFAGSMSGVACSAPLAARIGFTGTIAVGLTAMTIGVGGLALVGWPGALLTVACYGWGLGVAIPTTNLLVAARAPHRRAEALNLLNLVWGVGAMLSAPVVAWCAARARTDTFLLTLAAALGLLAIVLLAYAARAREAREAPAARQEGVRRAMWTSSVFFVYAALFYVYVGTENAVAGWIATFAHRVDASAAAGATPALFWAGLLAGRGAVPMLLRRTTEQALVQGGLALAAASLTLILLSPTLTGIMAGTALCGIGLSAVFPTTIAQLSRRFSDPGAAAAAFALAGLGGATVPWLVGILSASSGDLRAGLAVPLGGCLLMMALHACRLRHDAKARGL
jgi:fucose permease